MAGLASRRRVRVERLGEGLLLVWAGLSIGVAFLATPAKFLAPSLSLPVALDVGRQTFNTYNCAELALLVALVVLAATSQAWRRWSLVLVVPGVVVIAQALWLLPALDARTSAIIAGQGAPPRSSLHVLYIAAELFKLAWLLGFGLRAAIGRQPGLKS